MSVITIADGTLVYVEKLLAAGTPNGVNSVYKE